jgi:leucyl aminopeptidase
MDFNIKTGQPEKLRSDCLILPVFEPSKLPETSAHVDKISKGYLQNILKMGDLTGKCGQTMLLPKVPGVSSDRVLLVGCGKESEFSDKVFRDVIVKAVSTLAGSAVSEAACCLTTLAVAKHDITWKVQQAVVATMASQYKFDEFKSGKEKKKSPGGLKQITWMINNKRDQTAAERAVDIGVAISSGMQLMRDLANTPANICNPDYLAAAARRLGKTYKSISTAVLERKDLQALKMGALLSVGQGSLTPPKLITLEYRGANKSQAPVVLVGKGITFDTGGNSIKIPPTMIGMKFDMSGAAAVLGLMKFAALSKLPINLVGVIAAAENMPGNAATRPDDIVTTMAGITVEILNTDAEGRLVLCDALAYCERFKPEVVIDIATLTGACAMALGPHFAGLFSNYQPLADALLKAGNSSGDRCWQLPLAEEYVKLLDSNIADISNIAHCPEAGALIAAGFLSKFTQQYKWAHLDVAGTACRWAGKERGSTGQPIPLVAEYLLDVARN